MFDRIETLLKALQDVDADVRASAARALGKLGVDATDAVPFLLSALDDLDENVRAAAGDALTQITEPPRTPRNYVVKLTPEMTTQIREALASKK